MNKKNELKFSSFRRGDQAALKLLYEELYVGILCFARRLVERIDVADDIVMEAFEKAWKSRKKFKDKKSVKAFLYMTVRNACINFLTQQSVHNNGHKELLYLSGETESPSYLSEKAQLELIRSQVIEYFYREIKKFPQQMRKIFEMRLKKNYKYEVIARKLKTSVGNVRYQLTAGCQRLKEKPDLHKRWMLLRTLMRY